MTAGVLSTIEEWTGYAPLSCPWRAFFDPLVKRVMAAWGPYKRGQLAMWEPFASHRLMEAISFFDSMDVTVSNRHRKLEREQSRG
jgi:hypothetical protein